MNFRLSFNIFCCDGRNARTISNVVQFVSMHFEVIKFTQKMYQLRVGSSYFDDTKQKSVKKIQFAIYVWFNV